MAKKIGGDALCGREDAWYQMGRMLIDEMIIEI
jgi:hypothetical protein